MTRFFAVPLALLAAALPAYGQDAELQKLRQELDAQRAYTQVLQERLNKLDADNAAKAARIEELQKPKGAAPAPAPTFRSDNGLKRAATLAIAGLAARKPLEGKVVAVAGEIDLAVLSLGTDEGVREGDEFTVYRGGDFVAKVVVDRADRKWSAGKVVLKKAAPRVADDVSNHVFVSAPRAAVPDPVSPKSADALRDIRRELDEIRKQVRELSGRLLPAWARAGLSVEEAPEELREHLGVPQALLVKAVRAGSAGERAGLKVHDVLPRLTEAQLIEAVEKGSPIGIVRQGKPQTLGGK